MNNNLQKLIASVILLGITVNVWATAQLPDLLIYKGDTISIFSNPLESHPKMESIRSELFGDREDFTTNCMRGYQAAWKLIGNQLFLTAIYHRSDHKERADLYRIFGPLYQNDMVKADWVNNAICSPQGVLLRYVHSGYESVYSKEVIFTFKHGILVSEKTYELSRNSPYSQDSTFRQYVYSHIRWDSIPKLTEKKTIFVGITANEQGIIDSVIIRRRGNPIFEKEAVRVVKSIPSWDVYYRYGKHYRLTWNVPIVFSEENRKRYSQ